MGEKNEYHVFLGPADRLGRIEAAWADLLADCDRERSFFPMDYVDPRTGWTGSIEVVPVDAAAARRALSAYRTFNVPALYPTGFEDAMDRLVVDAPRRLTATAHVTFTDAD